MSHRYRFPKVWFLDPTPIYLERNNMRKMLVAALGFLLETVLSPGRYLRALTPDHLRPASAPTTSWPRDNSHNTWDRSTFLRNRQRLLQMQAVAQQQQGLQWSMAQVGAEGGGAVEQKAEEQRKKQTNRLRRNEAARRYQDEKEEQERLRRQCQSPPSLIELQPVAPLQVEVEMGISTLADMKAQSLADMKAQMMSQQQQRASRAG